MFQCSTHQERVTHGYTKNKSSTASMMIPFLRPEALPDCGRASYVSWEFRTVDSFMMLVLRTAFFATLPSPWFDVVAGFLVDDGVCVFGPIIYALKTTFISLAGTNQQASYRFDRTNLPANGQTHQQSTFLSWLGLKFLPQQLHRQQLLLVARCASKLQFSTHHSKPLEGSQWTACCTPDGSYCSWSE